MGAIAKLKYPKGHRNSGQQRRNAKGQLGWHLRWLDETSPGKRLSATFYGSQGSAEQYLESLEASPLAYKALTSGFRSLTVGELRVRALAAHKWAEPPMDGTEGVLRRPSTYAKFKSMMAMVANSPLDTLLVRTLSSQKLTQFVNSVTLKDGSKPSQNTLQTLEGQLSVLFAYAVDWGVILQRDNPTVKSVTSKRATKAKPVTWAPSLNDVQIVADIMDKVNDYYTSMLWVFYFTGMRCEEVMGLKLENVDLDRSSITIVNAVTVSGGVRQEGVPKSEASSRTIPIVKQCRPHLEFLIDRAKAKKSEYVFVGEGRPSRLPSEMVKKPSKRTIHAISYSTWRKALSVAVTEAGLQGVKYFTSHILRHSAIIQLLRAGYSTSEVASFAGHGSEKMVRTAYAGLIPNDLTPQADEMSRRLDSLG